MRLQTDRLAVSATGIKDVGLYATASMALIVGFTLLTGLCAAVRIPLPFTPVPITLQTLAVLLAGATIGSVRGAMSQLLYILWGITGLPLFAGGAAGLAVLAGPTGGYLAGFVLAAALTGRLIRFAENVWTTAVVFLIATGLILAAGWIHIGIVLTGGDMHRAFILGVLPFLPGAAIKITAAAILYRSWIRLTSTRGRK